MKTPEKKRAANRAWRKKFQATEEGHRRWLVYKARERAKKYGLACTITHHDFKVPKRCPLLGVKLKRKTDGKSGGLPESPSLDRINPRKGYIPGNIWVISYRANQIKNDATLKEFQRIAKNWEARLGKK